MAESQEISRRNHRTKKRKKKHMLKLLLQWLVSLFTADRVGVIVRKLLINTGTQVAKDIFNVEHQKKAYLFVKELN